MIPYSYQAFQEQLTVPWDLVDLKGQEAKSCLFLIPLILGLQVWLLRTPNIGYTGLVLLTTVQKLHS